MFTKEIKDVLDFSFMLNIEDDIKKGQETIEGSLNLLKEHGKESMNNIVKRQNCEIPPSEAHLTKIQN